jgi:hypothetical protein
MLKKRKHIKHHRIQRKTKMRGLSWISVLIGIIALSILLGGFILLPKFQVSETPGNNSIVQPITGCTSGDNLHLCTFNVITVTPLPPTPPPANTNQGTSNWQGGNNNSHGGSYGGGGSYEGGSSNEPYQGNYSGGGSGGGGGGSGGGGGGPPPL